VQNIGHTSHTTYPTHTPVAPVAVPPPVRRIVQRPVVQPPIMPRRVSAVTTAQAKPTAHLVSLKTLLIVLAIAFGGMILILMVARSPSESKASSGEKTLSEREAPSKEILSSLNFFSGPKYEINCKVKDVKKSSGIEVTVKGKAEKLAILMTMPNGQMDSKIVEKETLMTNSATTVFTLEDFEEGTYLFVVKLFDSEKVVAKKEFSVSLQKLWVDDINLKTEKIGSAWGDKEIGLKIEKILVTYKKEGNLPIRFDKADVLINGMPCIVKTINTDDTVRILVYRYKPSREMIEEAKRQDGNDERASLFRLGNKCLIKGTLFYGEDKSLDFEKEIVFTEDLFK